MLSGTAGGGGGGGGCGEGYALDSPPGISKWMKGDGVGFSSSIDGGGNCGVCVGVLGDESWADSGDEYVSKGGGLLAESSGCACFGATDVRLESPDEAFASRPSPIGCDSPPSVVGFGNFSLGDFRAVLAFEALDFVDTLDLTSRIDFFIFL
jgi:hypothetical protein